MTRPGILSRLSAVAALALAFGCAPPAAPAPGAASPLPSSPPWPAPADAAARIRAAGLEAKPMGEVVLHFHPHLEVYYEGQKVTIPEGVGIIPGRGMSALHTHGTDGTIHIEAYTRDETFTLGQFFTQWGVPLTGATARVNGEPAPDPASVVLADRQTIVVFYGAPPKFVATAARSNQGASRRLW